ncbi:Uncharacterised protein [Yersinia enterocolitica]|nr:Uncharacterised protein [Yersinia enterocolitica]
MYTLTYSSMSDFWINVRGQWLTPNVFIFCRKGSSLDGYAHFRAHGKSA